MEGANRQLGTTIASSMLSAFTRGLRTPASLGKPFLRSFLPSTSISRLSASSTAPSDLTITVVRTAADAQRALAVLRQHPKAVWACDTEVDELDVKSQSPVGNGRVICASVYGGESVNFGGGNGGVLWIENAGESRGVLSEFRDWFEDEGARKVWHNYGFDRHVLGNEGINCRGFFGDTMHMARLWDSSRDKGVGGGEGYSLASLTAHFFGDRALFVKTSMKELFGKSRARKDGSAGLVKELPPLMELQTSPETRSDWIRYSARDAVATFMLHRELSRLLRAMPWVRPDGSALGSMEDFYLAYLRPFGQLLTDMEHEGIRVDVHGHLRQAEARARAEREEMQRVFLAWASSLCPEAEHMNLASPAQVSALLFGHYEGGECVSGERVFRIEKDPEVLEREQQEALRLNKYVFAASSELKTLCKERGLSGTGSKSEITEKLLAYDRRLDELLRCSTDELLERLLARGLEVGGAEGNLVKEELARNLLASELAGERKQAARRKKERKDEDIEMDKDRTAGDVLNDANVQPPPKKHRDITIHSIGLVPYVFTQTGQPQVNAALLKKLAGKDVFGEAPLWGEAYNALGGGPEGERACRALGALAAVGQMDATINNFLVPLQALADARGRVHCSLNLNTETGRLSSRKPNLQNQPALEKDAYKIRDAFVAEPGSTLIVADYGQLELRVLAHITRCESMLQAFRMGGCFHSRTAMGMFDYIKESVDSGRVLLEWDYSKGQPNVPLVKDTFASERRKAKTLNFSIAYGKTVHGLAQDWGISKEEAQAILDAWYKDRPEVRDWQQRTQQQARKEGFVRTIMGRYRKLPQARSAIGLEQGHALRAAINTPIQGSAADIVMMAMLRLWRSPLLKERGWRLLLQIHDEVILEGPAEYKDEVLAEVVRCMEQPFDDLGLPPLLVHLDVDAKSADSWYKAK